MEDQKQITFQNFNQPANVDHLAHEIRRHVSARGLTAKIKGREYPLVEAWQYAGALIGLFPRVVSCEDLSSDDQYKYRAEVEVIDSRNGEIISRAFAFCSNKEQSKKYFDEYAIASMAQTRAVGKAFRVLLAWILQASGYEATPAEEMPDMKDDIIDEYANTVISCLGLCTTAEQVKKIGTISSYINQLPAFRKAAKETIKKLNK